MSRLFRNIITIITALATTAAHADNLASIMRTADSLFHADQLEEAIPYYERLAELYEIGQADASLCQSLQNAGDVCFFTNRYIDALQYYTFAIQLAEHYHNIKVYDTSTSYIGTTYALFNDYEQSIHYFLKAYQSAVENKNDKLKSETLVNLVASYAYMGQVDKAKDFFEKQRETPLQDSIQYQYRLLYNQGLIARMEGYYGLDVDCMCQLREFIARHGLAEGFLVSVSLEQAKAELELRHYPQALKLAKQTEEAAERRRFLYLLNEAYRVLSETYAQMGEQDSSLTYQGKLVALTDSVFNQRKFNQAKDKLFKYEVLVTDKKMESLQKWIMMLGLLVLSLGAICVVIFYFNRKLNATYLLLVNQNKEVLRQNDELRMMRSDAKSEPSQAEASAADDETDAEPFGSEDTARQVLSDARVRLLAMRIDEVLDDIDTISDPNFSLQSLAQRVGSNMKYVSTVVNQVHQKNFKSLLNEYRVREACRRLQDEQHYGNMTIQAIAQTVGYHNVNNFIVAFKRVMGMPPSKYKQLANNAPQP